MVNIKSGQIILKMKFYALAILSAVSASSGPALPDHLGELFSNKESLYGNNWEAYKKSRQLMVDCDIYESENWLGTGKCKYSWECRGARQCEGQGWCYGDDACKEIHE